MNNPQHKQTVCAVRKLFPNYRPHKEITVVYGNYTDTVNLDELSYEDYCCIVDMFGLNKKQETK